MAPLDAALARFHQTDFEYGGGLSNHGPMVAEALSQLGHPALIEGLVDMYAPRLAGLPVGCAISDNGRAAALGVPQRSADWLATFEQLLDPHEWSASLRDWAGRMLPGLFGGAAHGLLRTAHAVRALEAESSAVRLRELAMGLAYWAARHQRLPGTPGGASEPGQLPARALEQVEVVAPEHRRMGFFFDAVRVLDERPAFARSVEAIDLAGLASNDISSAPDISGAVNGLCRSAAALYLKNPGARIAYVHVLTAPSALRLFAHHLEPEDQVRALGYATQASMALHSVSATGESAGPSPEVERLAKDPAEIRYRAACSLGEHAIKLTEACLREYTVDPDPVFLLAAADAAIHLDSGDGRGAVC